MGRSYSASKMLEKDIRSCAMTALVTAFGTISISSSEFSFILHIENIQTDTISYKRCSLKKGVLRNFATSQENNCARGILGDCFYV